MKYEQTLGLSDSPFALILQQALAADLGVSRQMPCTRGPGVVPRMYDLDLGLGPGARCRAENILAWP